MLVDNQIGRQSVGISFEGNLAKKHHAWLQELPACKDAWSIAKQCYRAWVFGACNVQSLIGVFVDLQLIICAMQDMRPTLLVAGWRCQWLHIAHGSAAGYCGRPGP